MKKPKLKKKPLRSRIRTRARRRDLARNELKGRAERILKSANRQSIVVDEPELWPPQDGIIHVNPDTSCYCIPRNGSEERPFRRINQAIRFAQRRGYTFKMPTRIEMKHYERHGRIQLQLLRQEPKQDQGVYAVIGKGE